MFAMHLHVFSVARLQKNPAIVTCADLKSYFYRFKLNNLQSVFFLKPHVIQSKKKSLLE